MEAREYNAKQAARILRRLTHPGRVVTLAWFTALKSSGFQPTGTQIERGRRLYSKCDLFCLACILAIRDSRLAKVPVPTIQKSAQSYYRRADKSDPTVILINNHKGVSVALHTFERELPLHAFYGSSNVSALIHLDRIYECVTEAQTQIFPEAAA